MGRGENSLMISKKVMLLVGKAGVILFSNTLLGANIKTVSGF